MTTPNRRQSRKREAFCETDNSQTYAHQIDTTDLKILAALQKNGRVTNIALSALVGITAPPCLRRVQRLEAKGYIRRYHAEVDALKLGYRFGAFLLVGLVSQTDHDIKAFERAADAWPLVRECYSLTGGNDFLLRCVAHDRKHFEMFMADFRSAVPNIEKVRIMVLASQAIMKRGLPIPETLSTR